MGVTFGRVKPFSVRPHGTEMHFCPWMSIVLLLAFLTSPGTAQIFNALYEFQGNSDGGGPNDVIRDSAGNLYGTTVTGGIAVYGTVFKLDTSGKKTTLYEFKGGIDGEQPHGNLLLDANGNLYGTTEYGGACPPLSTRGCAPARRCIRVPTPRRHVAAPRSAHTSAGTSDALNDHHATIPVRQCSPSFRFGDRLPFKSHSAPRPPQTPAASS
jgi:uncharacterized repeat protein (TIGR03803 family)